MVDKKNKKNQKPHKKFFQAHNFFKVVFFVFIFLLVCTNLFYSQLISPLYSQIVNDNKKATIEFLKKIKNQPEFNQELDKYKTIYGKSIENEVFAYERQRKEMIKKLEQILQKNPQARDVLYSLSLLYNEDGDKIRAQEYLRRVKEVDPNINIKY